MNQLYLTILLPLIGFLILVSGRKRLSENVAAIIGVGSIGLAALFAALAGYDFLQNKPEGGAFVLHLWTWVNVGGFAPAFNLSLDGLSLTMLGVITGVGFLIHLFASWYMRGDEDYARFFSYMNLFLASMVLLVLGDNLVSLYFGWEGVGLCSYLLIGYYYRDPANGAAARKAFVVTRVGDAFMAVGLFVLYMNAGTLNIHDLMAMAPNIPAFAVGSTAITFATLMLLGGAVGKSAQLPLQTWLADAMAGPTPVSALIHAATMVTAGVYLIARTHVLFELAPDVLYLVGVVGAITLFIAGFAALVQTDIKRILAYSTMSQIGYMFLALGVKAYQPAIWHLVYHAFFKALLFLSSGAVIIVCHHEQNIFKMGGLRKKIPFVYACFLVGGAALVALPWVTVGFYSKDEILLESYSHPELFWAGLIGAFMTAIYTFRLIFVAFHGEAKTEVHAIHGADYWLPLGILLVLSTGLGALIVPPLNGVLPGNHEVEEGAKHFVEIITIVTAIAGTLLATFLFLFDTKIVRSIASSSVGKLLTKWWFAAWGFDWLYNLIFVKPFLFVANLLRRDPIDTTFNLIPAATQFAHRLLSATQTGSVRWYAATIAAGVVIILAALVLL